MCSITHAGRGTWAKLPICHLRACGSAAVILIIPLTNMHLNAQEVKQSTLHLYIGVLSSLRGIVSITRNADVMPGHSNTLLSNYRLRRCSWAPAVTMCMHGKPW